MQTLNALFVTSEARPLIKTGGLADVSSALPAALRELGIDCRILLPGYPQVMDQAKNLRPVARLEGLPGDFAAHLLQGEMPDTRVPVYVLQADYAYRRPGGLYQNANGTDFSDNDWRFALLSHAAMRLCLADSPLDWRPDLLHANDWQTGLTPAYLHFAGRPVPSVITIHNIAFQGIFPPERLADLWLPAESFAVNGVEYYGNLSLLKAGLYYADHIATVSPSYALEIQQEPLGMGMQGLLSDRAAQISGILNGIDTSDWNPTADLHLPAEFSARRLAGKKRCKAALRADLGLENLPDAPLFGVISRLTFQKGLDWVLQIAPGLIDRGVQLAILGKGEADIEAGFTQLAARYPGKVATLIGYDEGLSHRIEAGADVFLMPSRFEPCGLNQMYSQRYGTLPIVHATGGLRDTVNEGVDGFVFAEPTAHALWLAIERALAVWARPQDWKRMQQTAMKKDFSWEPSATAYLDIYRQLVAAG